MACATADSKSVKPTNLSGAAGVEARERERMAKAAPSHISSYFGDKLVPVGFDLHSDRYIRMCVETDIFEATNTAYRLIEASGRFASSCIDGGGIPEDIRMVIRILRGIKKRCIPQEFSAGIMLMHLEILEGMSFSSET